MSLLKEKKVRIPQYDLIRAVAMFLVVYVHSSFMLNYMPTYGSKQMGLFWFTDILALVCNGLFFMVSGKFNLTQATELGIGGYRKFYSKKVIDLLLPVAFYAIAFWVLRFVGIKIFGAWDDGVNILNYNVFLKTIYQLLISSWWFVPTIFSLMIFTPFLGRMLSSLKIKETYVLLGLLFGCSAVIALENLLGVTTILSQFIAPVFGIWAGYYILGYVIDKIKISTKLLSGMYALAGALVVIFGLIFVLEPQLSLSSGGEPFPAWKAILSAVFYPAVAIALFLLFKNIQITGDKVKRIVEFVGNRAYGIYLIHFCFIFSYLQLLPKQLRGSDNVVSGVLIRLVITTIVYLISLMIATIVDLLVVNPIQKRLKILLLR